MVYTIETAQSEIHLSDEWRKLKYAKIAAVEFNPIDRHHLLVAVAAICPNKTIYYWNSGYKYLQQYTEKRFDSSQFEVGKRPLDVARQIESSAVFIFEGLGQVDRQLGFELKNLYFEPQQYQQQILIADSYLDIPIDLFAIVQTLRIQIPKIEQIEMILELEGISNEENLANACFGLYRGEIEMLLRDRFDKLSSAELKSAIVEFKTRKLAQQGLKIAPAPDLDAVGGLDKIEEDLEKIRLLSSAKARERGLSLPRACLLLGLPGTGKSLISKLMGKKLGAILVACDWNQLIDSNLSRSLSNLQRVLDIVDNIGGTCILFFDEFEKAYSGWDTGGNGGVLSKMAGKLLSWMQDHTSPVIMLATINYLKMLPPELVRRFDYKWFFDSDLHNGAMYEIFLLHIEKHFPDLSSPLNRSQWFTIFGNYRGCSPAEIGRAVAKTHHELFCMGQYENIDPEMLKIALVEERNKFTPAIENRKISDALAEMRRDKFFARPVRGEDKSEFAVSPKGLFGFADNKLIDLQNTSSLPDDLEESLRLFRLLLDSEPDKQYFYVQL